MILYVLFFSFLNTYVDKRTHLCYNLCGDIMYNRKKHFFFCFWNTILALFFGALIYIFLRENTLLHNILDLSFSTPIHTNDNSTITKILQYHLTDALWAYALTMALIPLLDHLWAAGISIFFGTLWEFLQKESIVIGTADFIDILMYLTASILAALINFHYKRRLL